MGDYSRSKPRVTKGFPNSTVPNGVAGFSEVESFLTPERLRAEFLFGIPLKSPLTGETMTDDTLKVLIRRAAARVELETGVDITPKQRFIRLDFDVTKYFQGWGQLDTGFPNIKSIEELSIRTVDSVSTENPNPPVGNENGTLLYNFPLAWIDIQSYGQKGLLHLVPLMTSVQGTGIAGAGANTSYNGAAAVLLTVFTRIRWQPSFWAVKFTTGFDDNAIPAPVNQLIGDYAALAVLAMLGPVNKFTSKSIGIDSTSQGLGTLGPNWFALRMQGLNEEIAQLKDLIKSRFHSAIFMTSF